MSVQLRASNIGRVKYNTTLCDLDGTVNASGDYIKFDTAYDLLVKADADTAYLYDFTDTSEVVAKTLPYADSTYGNKFFISATDGIVALYDEEQTGQTLADIVKQLDLYEYSVDSDGDRTVDSEGYYALAPKSTTTIY